MATGSFTDNSKPTKTLKTVIKSHRKGLKTLNLAYTMLLVQGRISQKKWLSMCLLAVLGLQGVVVKCNADIFFRWVDYIRCLYFTCSGSAVRQWNSAFESKEGVIVYILVARRLASRV